MVKDKKMDVVARDYTINLHKRLHGMCVIPPAPSPPAVALLTPTQT